MTHQSRLPAVGLRTPDRSLCIASHTHGARIRSQCTSSLQIMLRHSLRLLPLRTAPLQCWGFQSLFQQPGAR